jgi:hypothetical protein
MIEHREALQKHGQYLERIVKRAPPVIGPEKRKPGRLALEKEEPNEKLRSTL